LRKVVADFHIGDGVGMETAAHPSAFFVNSSP
jgi:hypothetical protein